MVLAVLAGLFGMHALTVGHSPMTMSAAAAAQPMAHAVPAQPRSATPESALSVGSGPAAPAADSVEHPATGSAGHTGHTASACVAVLAAAAVLILLTFRRVLARRRGSPSSGPVPARTAAVQVSPRVVPAHEALSLFELCVLRV